MIQRTLPGKTQIQISRIGKEKRVEGDGITERKNVPKDLSHFANPPSLTGEADDSAISHLAERTTDSSVLVRRRTKHPPEKLRTCPHVKTHTHTQKQNATECILLTLVGYTLRKKHNGLFMRYVCAYNRTCGTETEKKRSVCVCGSRGICNLIKIQWGCCRG